MNREKAIVKIIKNKKAQGREEYAKNKPQLVESEIKEKTEYHDEHHEEQVNSASEKETAAEKKAEKK
ncbi:MAG: hypothetical protein LBG19_09495 [Prevotellaceae bacterium]|jgi:ketosteroid isomerase-like protein|nr:hypothetical protein [Prevotellaceae bacterium]